MLSSIKLWIELNIPRIEDGNNFGVSVQVLLIENNFISISDQIKGANIGGFDEGGRSVICDA
jgi:hypothetical protein